VTNTYGTSAQKYSMKLEMASRMKRGWVITYIKRMQCN
jgi:hypothetical protein